MIIEGSFKIEISDTDITFKLKPNDSGITGIRINMNAQTEGMDNSEYILDMINTASGTVARAVVKKRLDKDWLEKRSLREEPRAPEISD